ncbi:MAG: CatB-related O-acetyltransferase [Acidimicrobiales bacterium]
MRADLMKERRWNKLLESGQLSFGRYSYGRPDIFINPGETQRVLIGSFCSIAGDVRIFVGGNHRTDWVSTFPFRIVFDLPGKYSDGCPASKGDVVIGHDVWIGAGATVLSGVQVGSGAVIGASSVVANDVPPYAIVVGNPAREIRKRFSEEYIVMLEHIAWWHWPLERIIDNVELLCSPDIASFCSAHLDSRSMP